jgi:hypothetical protein
MRPIQASMFAVATAVCVALAPVPAPQLRLAARTVLLVPGNLNPTANGVENDLDHYFDPADPNFGFPGYDVVPVPWRADSFGLFPGYTASQSDGIAKLHAAIDRCSDVDDEDDLDKLVVAGYSSGALVAAHEIAAQSGLLSPEQLEFILIGGPHRGNGGVLERFPTVTGWLGVRGPLPDTDFPVTDIAYEYDPISDFPAYPLLPLTALNAALGWYYLHLDYQHADLGEVIDDPNMTYVDEETGVRFVTIAAPHLPLLMPVYQLIEHVPVLRPVLEPPLKLLEPALKALVDLGYRRDVPVGEKVPVGVVPALDVAKAAERPAYSESPEPDAEPEDTGPEDRHEDETDTEGEPGSSEQPAAEDSEDSPAETEDADADADADDTEDTQDTAETEDAAETHETEKTADADADADASATHDRDTPQVSPADAA